MRLEELFLQYFLYCKKESYTSGEFFVDVTCYVQDTKYIKPSIRQKKYYKFVRQKSSIIEQYVDTDIAGTSFCLHDLCLQNIFGGYCVAIFSAKLI